MKNIFVFTKIPLVLSVVRTHSLLLLGRQGRHKALLKWSKWPRMWDKEKSNFWWVTAALIRHNDHGARWLNLDKIPTLTRRYVPHRPQSSGANRLENYKLEKRDYKLEKIDWGIINWEKERLLCFYAAGVVWLMRWNGLLVLPILPSCHEVIDKVVKHRTAKQNKHRRRMQIRIWVVDKGSQASQYYIQSSIAIWIHVYSNCFNNMFGADKANELKMERERKALSHPLQLVAPPTILHFIFCNVSSDNMFCNLSYNSFFLRVFYSQ